VSEVLDRDPLAGPQLAAQDRLVQGDERLLGERPVIAHAGAVTECGPRLFDLVGEHGPHRTPARFSADGLATRC
jgi:hypothetical protein